jgi:methylglyoxal synthase
MGVDMERRTIKAQKRIALVAHDNRKETLAAWAVKNEKTLSRHFLCGTGTTARLVTERTGLPVHAYRSGPLGGDLKIGSLIAELEIDLLIFFWDPLASQPHDPDVKALLRIAALYNIPVATNQATADFILTSEYMEKDYEREILDFKI